MGASAQLDQAGWRILACCRNPDKADELNLLANNADGRITIHRLDVTDHAAIDALAGELKDEAIDVLNNNAGVAGGLGTEFEFSDVWGQTDYEKWRWANGGKSVQHLQNVRSFYAACCALKAADNNNDGQHASERIDAGRRPAGVGR